MNKRRIPNTDLELSEISLGTMTFGSPVSEPEAIRLIHAALDWGINAIDTADMYEGYNRHLGSAGGVAEHIVGQALRDRRHQAIVTTKVGSDVGHGVCLKPQYIQQQAEASLRRLHTDYIDIHELHRPDPQTPLRDTLGAIATLIEQKKVRYWGLSNYPANEVRQTLSICDDCGFPRPVVMQPPYSWLNRDFENDLQPLCVSEQIAVTPYQPLQGGLLTGKYHRGAPLPANSRAQQKSDWLNKLDDQLYDRLEAFEREASQAGRAPIEHALRWLLDQNGVVSVIVGVKSSKQLRQMLPA